MNLRLGLGVGRELEGRELLALLAHARRWGRPGSPFVGAPRMRSVTWVEPRLEAEVSYAEIVEGRLRAPSWRGLTQNR